MNYINQQIRKLESEILRKKAVIVKIQNQCGHPNKIHKKILVKVPGSELDFYENHFSCPTCHKLWRGDSTY